MKLPFQVIDLTHPITSNSPTWEGGCGFLHEINLDYDACPTPVQFRVQTIKMNAGIGTHIDAPAHCIPGAKTVDELSLSDLIAPCVVINISMHAHATYECLASDILTFEKKYGKIPNGSFVIIRTGWEKFWLQPDQYRNQLQFPSVSLEAANLLLARHIVGLGIDTLSPDTEASGYPVHHAILGAEKYIIENIANADKLPPTGSFSLALPILTTGGTEASIRLIALLL